MDTAPLPIGTVGSPHDRGGAVAKPLANRLHRGASCPARGLGMARPRRGGLDFGHNVVSHGR